ncbi:MAG: hypothetical protein Q8P18_03915 [Pseudomonadota bacterium]|nr:hypothetical protein [Pseudomonadota bacterium]
MSISEAIEHFITTGEHDPHFANWEGNVVERRRRGSADLRDVLTRIVGYRSARGPGRRVPDDVAGQVRRRVAPMVEGLLSGAEAAAFAAALGGRVHVVTPTTFGTVIEALPPRVGWDIANLLLDDLGAPPLSDDTPELDGMCSNGQAWLLPRAFTEARPYSDVVVHEVAHLLHTVRSAELGLTGARPLLAVPPRRRETFAYACEVWACVTRVPAERWGAELDAFRDTATPADARVDRDALDRVLGAALGGGGWAVIGRWAIGRR